MNTYIYALVCPCTSFIKYIGKANNPSRRYKDHLTESRGEWKKIEWIRNLRQKGLKPIMILLESCPIEIWKEREKHYMEVFKNVILNTAPAGVGLTVGNRTTFKKIQ